MKFPAVAYSRNRTKPRDQASFIFSSDDEGQIVTKKPAQPAQPKRNSYYHLKPFGFFDYDKLQLNAFCVLSDSETLSEESAILGLPAVPIRTSTERLEVSDKGTIVIGGMTKKDITQAVELSRVM